MNKKSALTSAFIGVGSVWIGGHIGPGYATGTSMTTWFVKYGVAGIFLPLIAMAVCGGVMYIMLEFARRTGSRNYKDLAHNIYGKGGSVATVLYDLSFLVTVFCAGGICVSGEATLLQQMIGLNYWVGCILTIAVSALLCLFGSKLLSMASAYMMYFVIVVVVLITVLAFAFGDNDLAGSIANSAVNAKDSSFFSALWHAVLYGCFQASLCFNVISCSDILTSKSDSKKAVIWGYVCNIFLMLMFIAMMFSYTNVFDITAEALPVLAVLERLNFTWLTAIYVVLMTLAVLSSAAGLAYAGSSRFDSTFKFISQNSKVRRGVISVILLGLATAAASLGLKSLMSTGNSINGYVSIAVVVIPAYTFVLSKLKKMQAADKVSEK